jgi:hypothetical protein
MALQYKANKYLKKILYNFLDKKERGGGKVCTTFFSYTMNTPRLGGAEVTTPPRYEAPKTIIEAGPGQFSEVSGAQQDTAGRLTGALNPEAFEIMEQIAADLEGAVPLFTKARGDSKLREPDPNRRRPGKHPKDERCNRAGAISHRSLTEGERRNLEKKRKR